MEADRCRNAQLEFVSVAVRSLPETMLWLWLLILVVGTARPTLTTDGSDSCWSTDGDEATCLIHATLFKGVEEVRDEPGYALPLVIDCGNSDGDGGGGSDSVGDATAETSPGNTTTLQSTLLARRLDWAKSVLLDGCRTALGATVTSSYGLELLPNCARLAGITIDRFHADVIEPFICPKISTASADAVGADDLDVEILHFRRNEFGSVTASSLRGLQRLRALHFAENSLRRIEPAAFEQLRQIELIVMQDESLLAIKAGDADLFARTGVAELRLIALKRLSEELFSELPETLRQLRVERTRVEGDAVRIKNPLVLGNLSIVDCGLKAFSLHDAHATVWGVNLSGNALEEFELIAGENKEALDNATLPLSSLDLSHNQLSVLPTHWLRGAPKLHELLLSGNRLVTLSLPQLLAATPSAVLIDLRDNLLVGLRDTAASHFDVDRTPTRLRIDRNPWHCVWLLDFAHAHPEQFRLFQYEKFISRINVNGLQCIADDVGVVREQVVNEMQHQLETSEATSAPLTPLASNVSTYTVVYGSPWDLKRNQRAEALIIVFMLPLGIALLFLLLYLWINCQRMFHLSYYRAMGGGCRSVAPSLVAASRFDVVRELPSGMTVAGDADNNNDGYETPLNGVASTCNCNHSAPTSTAAADLNHCSRMHITYVPLPAEQPYKIYEEIIEVDGDDGIPDPPHPFYDHLRFVDPIALQ